MSDVLSIGVPQQDPTQQMADPSQVLQGISPIPFDSFKVAPSLVGIEPTLDEYADPFESYIFDEEQEEREKKTKFGLNVAQQEEIMKRASRCADEASSYWSPIYDKMEQDLDMYSADDMWTPEARALRAGRPVLQFPVLSKFVERTVADMKRNPKGVRLSPRENGDIVKARIGMDLIRYIEDTSGAKDAYIKAVENSAICGLGWIKGSFRKKAKKIVIDPVEDPLKYMIDPDSRKLDGSDAMYVISETMKTKNKEVVSCYEYWWKEKSDEEGKEWEVYWALIDGNEIVDYGRFPGEIIPVFPVFGKVIRYKDKHVVKGIVRDLADAQRSYNYMKSQEVEIIALTPKSPIMAEEGTIPDQYRKDWENCTKNPSKVLFYSPTRPDGTDIKFQPQFLSMKADTQWAQAAAASSIQDLKEITGIYDTALGSDNKELSGKAIIAKQITADAGQISYDEHLQATLQQVGKWIIGMIVPVMGTERVVRILGENGKFSTVNLDKPMGELGGEMQQPIDLDFSEMDISVGSGNSYATRRETALDMFQNLMQALPNTATVLADLIVKNMDFDEAEEAASRLHRMLPPEVRDESAAPEGFVPAYQLKEAVQMFEQTKGVMEQTIAQLQSQNAGLQAELKNQFQSRIAAERIKGEYNLANTQIKEQNQNARKVLEIQKGAEETSARIQADLLKDVTDRASEAARVVVVDQPSVPGPQQQEAPEAGLDITFKDPTIGTGRMSNEDMLMNL